MSEPFLGQLTLGAWNFAPKGYAQCNGQLLPIAQNQALFSLLGTIYGGNGVTTFALPNLQGRTPIGWTCASSPYGVFDLGQAGGEASHTLLIQEIPSHTHTLNAVSDNATAAQPAGAFLGSNGLAAYGPSSGSAVLNPQVVGMTGGSQPHENRQPFLVMNWCIALTGIFPTRS